MEEQLFQTSNSQFGILKFWVIRLIAISAFIFAIYDFNENIFFFSILIIVSAFIFFIIGPWRITLYKEFITVENKGLLKNSPLKKRYNYHKLKEVTADIPNDITDMVLKRVDPLSMSYRFVIIPKKETPKTFWITTNPDELRRAVELTNQFISESVDNPGLAEV
jgi:hypothetical protein